MNFIFSLNKTEKFYNVDFLVLFVHQIKRNKAFERIIQVSCKFILNFFFFIKNNFKFKHSKGEINF